MQTKREYNLLKLKCVKDEEKLQVDINTRLGRIAQVQNIVKRSKISYLIERFLERELSSKMKIVLNRETK